MSSSGQEPVVPATTFFTLDLRAGTVVSAEVHPDARKPSYVLVVDFGPLGRRRSSAQLTKLYDARSLIGRQVIAVTNLPPRRVGSVESEVLVTGLVLEDGAVVLAVPDRPVPDGSRLA